MKFMNKIYVIADDKFKNYEFFKMHLDIIILKYKLRKDNLCFIIGDNEFEYPIDNFVKRYTEENGYEISMIKIRSDLYRDRSEEFLNDKIIRELMRSDYSRGILISFDNGKNKRIFDFTSKANEFTINIERIDILYRI